MYVFRALISNDNVQYQPTNQPCVIISASSRELACVERDYVCVCVCLEEREVWLSSVGFKNTLVQAFPHTSINNTPHKHASVNSSFSACVCVSIQLHKFWLSLVVCSPSLLPKPQWDFRNVLIISNSIWAATRLTTKPLRRTGTNTANKCGIIKCFQWRGGLQWVNCQCDFNLWYHFIHLIVIYSVELVITGVAILI